MEKYRVRLINCLLCNFPVEVKEDRKGNTYYKCRNCGCMLIVYDKYGLQKLIEMIEKQEKERKEGVIKSE